MEVKIFPNGVFGATTYVVFDKETKEALLIDCTCCIDEITDLLIDTYIDGYNACQDDHVVTLHY